jgi:site-specific DNA-methyltransferase (adenine-specific)
MTYKRKEQIGDATLYLGDCLEILPMLTASVDAVITDPPYGVTSLDWDKVVERWPQLLPSKTLWCFGSMAFFMQANFEGWKYAQEIVWEKHNGSGFHADRFRRVHEFAVMFYRGLWRDQHVDPPKTFDATQRSVRRKERPGHMGKIADSTYTSQDGGPRIQRSVIRVRSCHGKAQHPTQKPVGIIDPLIQFSVPEGGTVMDPFMGSGSTGVACLDRGRKFIGIEIDERYFDVACERIRAANAQGRLIA